MFPIVFYDISAFQEHFKFLSGCDIPPILLNGSTRTIYIYVQVLMVSPDLQQVQKGLFCLPLFIVLQAATSVSDAEQGLEHYFFLSHYTFLHVTRTKGTMMSSAIR
jgi:hypothetical protein